MKAAARKRDRGGWLPPRTGGYHGYDGDPDGERPVTPPPPPPGGSGVSGFAKKSRPKRTA